MNDVLTKIGEFGIVPVVKINDANDAVALGKALLDGGLPVAEITFRTAAAEEAIARMSADVPEVFVGAGTVLTVENVKKAVAAGAKFIVSPGFNPKVVGYCVENNIPITPGINSPTQIEMALEFGLEVVKFFPAETSGGLPMLKALSAPYGSMKFVPTGGVSAKNLNAYLAFPKVLACGGSWMVTADLISAGKFDDITTLTKEAMATMLGFEFAHLGMNEETAENALNSANLLSRLFSFPVKDGSNSVFAGTGFEIMKSPYRGEHGHLAIATHHIQRAIAYLKRQGIGTLADTANEKDGTLKAIYLDTDVSGFAIHLLQK